MTERTPDEVRAVVRKRYGEIARDEAPGCGCEPSGCGGPASEAIGYAAADRAAAPEGADLGLGCGNPQAIAELAPGETVLDLGAGAGFDVFLAARRVGPTGRVIGVDMTPEMVSRARSYALEDGVENVDFRLGEIEHLPVADGSVDVILSNCVINLSPDQAAVYREAFRVLRPGGRLAIADVVALAPMPDELKQDVAALTGCVAGAARVEEVEAHLAAAGFRDVSVDIDDRSRDVVRDWMPGRGLENLVASARIRAAKP
jgi:SAM-dependent methyltransferase